MQGLSHLQHSTLSPIWRYKTRGKIWRVMPTASGKILGEERDIDCREVSFFCLNRSGEILWKELNFGEQWWMGIEAAHRDTIFFHRFPRPDLPEHGGITAVDLLTGSKLWDNRDLQFELAEGESVFASRYSIEGRLLIELDCRTGAILRSFGNDDQVVRQARTRAPDTQTDVEMPVPAGAPSTEVISAMLHNHLEGSSAVGNVEFIEHENLIIFSFHEQSRQKRGFSSVLQVLDKTSGMVVFSEILNTETPTIVPESFLVQDHVLFYIKNRRILTAIPLTRPPAGP